ncbi:hypothetical protein [Rhizobium sp. BK176]|nr:hypothetical protein [Rhizobium sp. BK176]MCS4089948.1 hypothetical protein [Rhizobium sp. BK176]
MTRNNIVYFIVGVVITAAVGFGVYKYHEEQKPEGIQLSVGENGVKIEAN